MIFAHTDYLSLPAKSGVYVFLDKKGSILYVGKAKDLKSRVSSYFANPNLLYGKTKMMVPQVEKIKITIVESELEALLLEAFYIKKHKPKYNILMKDGKSYILIRITIDDMFPKVLLARREDDQHSIYFGPFTSSSAVKLVLKIIRRIFPYQSVLNHPNRVCLYHHLGLCPCPPVFSRLQLPSPVRQSSDGSSRMADGQSDGGQDDSEEFKQTYRKNIKGIIRMLEGQSQKIMKELEKERDLASKSENYETALDLQKKINALSAVTTPFHKPFEYDVNPNLRIDIRQQELDELMKVLNQAYSSSDPELVEGESRSNSSRQARTINSLITKLERIECYDISNIQGTNATGSMVVLTNGEIDKSQYRKFKIRKDGKPNDFAMMKEVLKRRLNHNEWYTPDLIIVDGGKGQVSAAMTALASLGVSIPLIGLAKREETIVIPKGETEEHFIEVLLPKDSPAIHLITRIRDEAHRFAVTFHKKLRSKAAFL